MLKRCFTSIFMHFIYKKTNVIYALEMFIILTLYLLLKNNLTFDLEKTVLMNPDQ